MRSFNNCLILLVVMTITSVWAQKPVPPAGPTLRDLFSKADAGHVSDQRVIGRLGVLLLTTEGWKLVRSDHPFVSGDSFRFQVSSNKRGHVYVFVAELDGTVQQLWPRKDMSSSDNEVRIDQNYDIPPDPGRFRFDNTVGSEHFYVAIRTDDAKPKLQHTQNPPQKATTNEPAPTRTSRTTITNFMVKDPFGSASKGVVFDPGSDDHDVFLYFAATPEDKNEGAKIEFSLAHGAN